MRLACPRPWLPVVLLAALAVGLPDAEARPGRRHALPASAQPSPLLRGIVAPLPPRASATPSPGANPSEVTSPVSGLMRPGVPELTPVPALSLPPRPSVAPRVVEPSALPPRPSAAPRVAEPSALPARPAAVRGAAVPVPQLPAGVALFTRDGRPAGLADLVAASRLADVVFLGEFHDDPAAHALERAVLEALAPLPGRPPARPVALSLEMFETDVQAVLDEYLAGLIRERDFLAAARPWNNYRTDYRPLLELARERAMPVVAANAPHRYVMRVGRTGSAGLGALTPTARGLLAPLPWPTPSIEYVDRFAAFAAEAFAAPRAAAPVTHSSRAPRERRRGRAARPNPTPTPAQSHGAAPSVRLMFEAQWLRDTSMARSIALHLAARPGALVVHVNGLFHSQAGQGTVEALRHYRPGVRPLTLAITRRAGPPEFVAREMAGLGDFIAVTPQRPGR
ncbi:MAG: ChaN family lipoprotein [Candidatus Sericytochromatia bacterium]|nr:ChaN family lipoprotein [Candidatus Sericytochromatia bacterium]